MKIRYSRRASRDLEAIREYLTDRSPSGAVNVLTAIYGAIEFIRRYPDAGQSTRILDVRGKIVQRYHFKIFYRMDDTGHAVEIVHVRHTSRRLWSGED